MKRDSACYSTGKVEWSTPQWLFDDLSDIWGPFDLDVCADASNHKCSIYYTKEKSGMTHEWFGRVWCNPPYGPQLTGLWVHRGANAVSGEDLGCKAVACLIPARTDTAWWHDYCARAKEILLIRGRIPFGGAGAGAPFPSAAVLFEGPLRERGDAPVRHWEPPSRKVSARRGDGSQRSFL